MKRISFTLPLKKLLTQFRRCTLRLIIGSFLAVCLAVVGSHSALGDEKHALFSADFEPKIISGDSLDDWTAGISYDVNYQNFGLYNINFGEADTMLEARLTGTLALDSHLNKESLISEVLLGASLLTGKAGEDPLALGHDLKKDLDRASDYGAQAYFFAGADLRYETDQKLDEQNLAIGVETGFINRKDEGIYSFIPSIIMAVEWIDPFESELRDDFFTAKSGFSRFRIEASLKSSFGQHFFKETFLEPFGLRLDFRYFSSNDLNIVLESADQDEITYFSAALTYMRIGQLGPFKRQTFFIKISDGRIPPATQDETIVSIGVLCPLKK